MMKKRTGRMLSILLCFAMLLGLMPAAVLAAESGTLETGLTWTLENGVLTGLYAELYRYQFRE